MCRKQEAMAKGPRVSFQSVENLKLTFPICMYICILKIIGLYSIQFAELYGMICKSYANEAIFRSLYKLNSNLSKRKRYYCLTRLRKFLESLLSLSSFVLTQASCLFWVAASLLFWLLTVDLSLGWTLILQTCLPSSCSLVESAVVSEVLTQRQ